MNKPFLKWAGGKYRILPAILRELPQGARLVEPFAGSAAVYLNAPFERALVCDINSDLIGLYTGLQQGGDAFIALCATFFTPENNARERYYELRAQFNATKDSALRSALFLYLNRHAYNGLIRYSAKSGFNVPFGRYKKPYFPLAELQAFQRRVQDAGTEFAARDFRSVFAELRPGDVVYCDPPYVPLSKTAHFTAYAGNVFGVQDQRDLAELAEAARGRGIPVLLSNHDTELTRSLYAAADIRCFDVRRAISCNGSARRLVPELLAIYLPDPDQRPANNRTYAA